MPTEAVDALLVRSGGQAESRAPVHEAHVGMDSFDWWMDMKGGAEREPAAVAAIARSRSSGTDLSRPAGSGTRCAT